MRAFRILMADDHPITRLGLCSLLGSHQGWEVCGQAVDGRDAVTKCRQLRPDLLILDICMPKLNGVDAARQILADNPAQKILVLTDVDSEQAIRDCLKAGVRGWVLKSDETHDLTVAVEALQNHGSIYTSRVADLILDGYLERHRFGGGAPEPPSLPSLTPREREVVQLLCEGNSTKKVATILGVTVKTAETHRSNIMFKLKLHSVAELVLYAVRNGIVHIQLPTAALPDSRFHLAN